MACATDKKPEPRKVEIQASAFIGGITISRAEFQVLLADKIEVEPGSDLKCLPMRSGGYFTLPQAVFLVVDGERHEITIDKLPDGEQV